MYQMNYLSLILQAISNLCFQKNLGVYIKVYKITFSLLFQYKQHYKALLLNSLQGILMIHVKPFLVNFQLTRTYFQLKSYGKK